MPKAAADQTFAATTPEIDFGVRPSFVRFGRLALVGACFLIFYIGAALFSLYARFRFDAEGANQKEARTLVHGGLCFFVNLMSRLDLIKVDVRGSPPTAEQNGYIIAANHPSLIDIILLLSIFPDAGCITKQSLHDSMLLGPLFNAAGYLANHSSHHLIDRCVSRLVNGESIVIFPEGTRSPVGKLHEFKRGVAVAASRAGASLIPVVLRCKPAFLGKECKWYQVPPVRLNIDISIGDEVQMNFAGDERTATASANSALHQYFIERLGYG